MSRKRPKRLGGRLGLERWARQLRVTRADAGKSAAAYTQADSVRTTGNTTRELDTSSRIRCPGTPDERTVPAMMQLVREDKFFWASDYPHPDHPEELREMVAPKNVARAYKLS